MIHRRNVMQAGANRNCALLTCGVHAAEKKTHAFNLIFFVQNHNTTPTHGSWCSVVQEVA